MFLIDSHCHLDQLNDFILHQDRSNILDKAKIYNVKLVLSVSTTIASFKKMITITGDRHDILFSCGIHPLYLNEKHDIKELYNLTDNKKVIAIGETGLDYYKDNTNILKQQEIFRKHIYIGCVKNKPIIVHTRNAYKDTINILIEEQANRCGGILHCFTEDVNFARSLLNLGFYISFSGMITFRNATHLHKVVKYVPLDRILIETDAPYLTPVPHRGKENQPEYVYIIAECLARLKNVNLEYLSEITTANFSKLFNINIKER